MTEFLIGLAAVVLLAVVASFVRAHHWREYMRRRRPEGITDAQRQAVIMECFRTGKMVSAKIDDDGQFHMEVIDDGSDRG